jgi:hypothetical protein
MLLAIADQLEELSIVSARRRVFMHSRVLYAPTVDGRHFHLEILFRADADSDFQQRVFELAEAAAKQSHNGTTSEITESVKRRVTETGLGTDIPYTIRFAWESQPTVREKT